MGSVEWQINTLYTRTGEDIQSNQGAKPASCRSSLGGKFGSHRDDCASDVRVGGESLKGCGCDPSSAIVFCVAPQW